MRTKILYVTDTLVAGGVERQLTELVTRLDTSRFEIRIVCLYSKKAGLNTHFVQPLRDAGLSVTLLNHGMSGLDKLKIMGDIAKFARDYEPHIIHLLNYHSNFLGRFIRPVLPSDTVVLGTMRTTYTPKQLRYQRFTHGLCHQIIVNSPHFKTLLLHESKLPEDKIIVIPNGVDVSRFQNRENAAMHVQRPPDTRMLFMMPGRIHRGKGQHILARAVGELYSQGQWDSEALVWFVGNAQGEEEQHRLTSAIEQYGLHDIVRQLPRTKHIEDFYATVDICILTSFAEGMSNVALESLASGKPMIIAEGANAAGVIEHGVTGWVVKTGDVDDLATTLKHVLSLSDDTLQTMRENCHRAIQRYSMDAMVTAYTDLYTHYSVVLD